MRKKLIVCDYANPDGYTFPNFGMGSSEKRLWHFAKSASELEEYEVIITGPLWLPEYVPRAKHFPKRLDTTTYKEFLEIYGHCDFLFAGHEYFDKDEWVIPFEKCADVLLSYQLHPYTYRKVSFDGRNKILFCYSDEMVSEYKEQSPIKALLFHSGPNEEPVFCENPDPYILWIGRFDREKAPHYAIEATRILNKSLYMLGKSIYQPEYFKQNEASFSSSHVKLLGVKTGPEKMEIIAKSLCAIYTIDRHYSEAGAGVLGEILSCGVPIAGMTWKGDDAICEAVNRRDLGKVVDVRTIDESGIPFELAEAVRYCLQLDRKNVFELGRVKYDPVLLVKSLLEKAEEASESHT